MRDNDEPKSVFLGWCCPCILFGKTQSRLEDPSLSNYSPFNEHVSPDLEQYMVCVCVYWMAITRNPCYLVLDLVWPECLWLRLHCPDEEATRIAEEIRHSEESRRGRLRFQRLLQRVLLPYLCSCSGGERSGASPAESEHGWLREATRHELSVNLNP